MHSAFQMMPAQSFRLLFLAISLTGLLWPLPAESRQDPPKPAEQKPGQREDVISLDTSQVIMNVTVTDLQERYVAGLTAKNFKLFEDRVPQKILNFTASEMPFAAAILVDTSGSMEAKMSMARAACTRFVDGIREGDVFSIYTFGGTKVVKLQDFTEVRDVPDTLWDTRADGMTPLYDAVVMAVEALSKREERRRAILIVSDGADTYSRASFEVALRRAADANVAIYAVDLSDAALSQGAMRSSGAEVLKSFALKTGGRFFKTPGGSLLRDAFTQTVEELRNQYTIAYEPTNEKQDGKWRTIELRLDRPALIVRTRQGYYAGKAR